MVEVMMEHMVLEVEHMVLELEHMVVGAAMALKIQVMEHLIRNDVIQFADLLMMDNATVTLLSNSHVSFLQLRAGTSLPGLVAAKSFSSMVWTSLPGLVAFTKSFGSCGGYISASKEIIQHLKHSCPAHLYATSMSPPAVQQVISAIKVILGEDGSNRGAQKLARIRENSNFFRSELKKMGFEVLGDNDSPVMPIMLYNPAKIPAFSRECLRQKVVVVTVVFPATPLLLARARICISASHTREHLIKALDVISRVGDLVGIKYFPAETPKIAGADHDKLE
ncbi:Long chain base biosynthesis protein 2a [Zea mays]|uniref:serine C-palmitoyltransferase n=1 Tax=Zea mays TaxID=4577 RepID=A0A3L6FGR5_MAIZE|nr:Long chain base biosynthesis protein 2a [Zea mays]